MHSTALCQAIDEELDRLLKIERSARGLIDVMKEYPLNDEWWWESREALEEALKPN